MEPSKHKDPIIEQNTSESDSPVMAQLRQIVIGYLEAHPKLTTNSLSKRCEVSEPTLRRIVKGQVKTLPQISTLLSILTYISNRSQIKEVSDFFGPPLSDHIQTALPSLELFDQNYSAELNTELKDPVKYLIFKRAINHCGVDEMAIRNLFGVYGLNCLNQMVETGILKKEGNNTYFSDVSSYRSSNADFVRNFKNVADYIKPEKLVVNDPLNPYFVNKSDSVNEKTFAKIRKILRATQTKLDRLMSEPESRGNIPYFYIAALDTLDPYSAREITDAESED